MNWNQGYNVDHGYTYGHYKEQDPVWMDFCALLRGTRPPSALELPKLRYLELGCGQGNNLCLIAAQHPELDFVGVDFNPQHISHAQGLAAAAGLANIRFIEADFVELAREWPSDLGHFHYVSAHGIYTWIAPSVLAGLIDCLARATAPGALVYLSYNTLPGWISTIPVQHLLRVWQVREHLSSAKAIEAGRERLLALLEVGVGMTQSLPGMRTRIDRFPTLDRSYLIQEYLHDNWHPKWFDQIHDELAPAKLRFVGTATAGDWLLPSMLGEKERSILLQYSDSVERELMLDVLVNQGFRRDLWSRGQTPVWAHEQREALLSTRFALTQRPEAITRGDKLVYKYSSSRGEVLGQEGAYTPFYDALSSGPKTVAELMALPAAKPRQQSEVLQAAGLMLHAGHITFARSLPEPRPATAMNRAIARAVAKGAPYRNVIATALPAVISASDTDLILLSLAQDQSAPTAAGLASQLVEVLISLGRGLKREERSLVTRDDMLPAAVDVSATFLNQTLPGWRKLGVL